MIESIKEKSYRFEHPLATVVVDEIELGVSLDGKRYLFANEIERITRLAFLEFYKLNYRKSIVDHNFTLSARALRSTVDFFGVNIIEFAKLIGCEESKIYKILEGELMISRSHIRLVVEFIGQELARSASVRKLFDPGAELGPVSSEVEEEIFKVRYGD